MAGAEEGPASRKSTGDGTMMSRKSTGRRLSWADEGPPLSARPIADEIPVPTDSDVTPLKLSAAIQEMVSKGNALEQRLELGILRQGNMYGISATLPSGTTSAEVVTPLPQGMTANVKKEGKELTLLLECEYKVEGRHLDTIRVNLQGAEKPELLVHVEAKAMGPRDGRPSSIHNDLKLLRCASQESISASSEGAEWKRGELAMEGEQPVSP